MAEAVPIAVIYEVIFTKRSILQNKKASLFKPQTSTVTKNKVLNH